MAQVILSRVGAALGARAPTAFSALARTLGRAAGKYIGGQIDDALFGQTRRVEGARMTDAHLQASEEGASIPVVFGRARLAGQVIWAARYREHRDTQTTGGGKSGAARTSTTRYTYSLSFAVGLCCGEIARVERVWANGRPLDISTVAHRVHKGGEDQAPDPVIEAIEGASQAPAYRGLAYIVFEDLPLEAFGDAIPQLSFEIVRTPQGAAPRLESMAQAVCLIPASGEFVYATQGVRRVIAAGQETSENAHAAADRANLLVSLDQLQTDLPNVSFVSLTAAWFGDDLRCGSCTIRPGVEISAKDTRPLAWRAGGVDRAAAHLVSTVNGAPAYGGSPADATVVQAIVEMKARGLAVGLNPFLLMDVAAGNALPSPYGAATQPAYPWRGRITCMPASGETGTVDRTGAAGTQVDAFFGAVTSGDFVVAGGDVVCTGADWKYRQFILHFAHLAAVAGGVDVFVIGSELRGVTTLRSDATTFPAVAHLRALAAEVRVVLGPDVKIVYGADWSEYRGHQPQDGSGDVFFHLDPLWADANIAAVGIDWYPPLADWRDGDTHLDRTLGVDAHDGAYLASRIEAGEDYDWFYASDADRAAQVRTPITDGAYGTPWMFRAKDVRHFWSEQHFDRPGGVRASSPTAWTPTSKPVWLMELGAPAIDKGANAPNVFIDPKSAESAAPPFSSGARDDLIQRRALEAYLSYWDPDAGHNPVSPLTGARMIDLSRTCLWAWDARPFPQFPARADVWSDGAAWRRGHWLNGRAGAATLAEVVLDLCARAGVADVNAAALSGIVAGYIVDAPTTLRAALEPLMEAYQFDVRDSGGEIVFRHLDDRTPVALSPSDLVEDDPRLRLKRGDAAPMEARVRYLDGAREYRVASASARRRDAAGDGATFLDAPLVLDETQATLLAETVLAQRRALRETAELVVTPARLDLEPGDLVDLVDLTALGGGPQRYRIERVEDAVTRRLFLAGDASAARPAPVAADIGVIAPAPIASQPGLVVLDLPPLIGAETDERPLAAVYAQPWRGPVSIFAGRDRASASLRGVAAQPSAIGRLVWALYPGPLGRWDDGNVTRVHLPGADLSSVAALDLFAGANVFAVAQADGGWEIVQARSAVLVAPDVFELRDLLRGQQGTETSAVAPVGAMVVRLDATLARLDLAAFERGADLSVIAPPSGLPLMDAHAVEISAGFADVWARPLAPAHVRGRRLAGGDVALTWVRRGRLGGDAWQGEIPLGDETEAYRVEILDGGAVKRSWQTTTPAATYVAADQIVDFGGAPASLTVRIAQISQRHGAGRGRDSILQL